MNGTRRSSVAIVEDEVSIRRLYSEILEDDYDIIEAPTGDAALDLVDENVDVMLIDRELGDRSGEDVVHHLRGQGSDTPVAMVTAKYPELDLLEMDVDDYVVKPVGSCDLRALVERLLLRREYDVAIREFYALAAKLSVLRSVIHPFKLEGDDRYVRAEDRFEELRERALRTIDSAFDAGMREELLMNTYPTD